jgi:hypothetical protein
MSLSTLPILAKPPNRKRALEYLAALGAVPISISERDGMCSTIRAGGNSRGTGCDLVHILDPKINDSLELMVQINSNNEVGSCLPYSTSSTANTAVPASPKCGNNF